MVKRTLSILRKLGTGYLFVALTYGLWAFVLLQFRECGPFGTSCTPFITQMATLFIAVTRGLLWLPNLVIAISQGAALDWLLLRDVPPIDQIVASFSSN